MAKRNAYRDSKTGRFVSRATYARSRAQGGTRYKRSRVSSPARPVKTGEDIELPRPPKPPLVIDDFDDLEDLLDEYDYEDQELGGGFDSPGGKKNK